MKKIFILSITASTLLFTQCTPKKATTKANAGTASGEVTPKHTDAELAEGKTISETSCKKCHKLHEPQEFTVADWEKILPGMAKRAKLTDEQTAKIHAYLVTNAKAS